MDVVRYFSCSVICFFKKSCEDNLVFVYFDRYIELTLGSSFFMLGPHPGILRVTHSWRYMEEYTHCHPD